MPFRLQYKTLLQTIFDCLIDSFIDDKVGLANDFLSVSLAAGMKANLLALYAEKQLTSAGIGNNSVQNHDKLIRNDKIFWLDRSHDNPFEIHFFALMDSFVSHLNRTCYTGITGYEFHYTMYEKGSFYKKHLDQFQNNKSRAFSMIMYLNVDWIATDGGELCIYHDDFLQTIAPQNGKCVFFKSSDLPHEVLMTNVPRLSITGWLKTN
jgi:SM-20-related protein